MGPAVRLETINYNTHYSCPEMTAWVCDTLGFYPPKRLRRGWKLHCRHTAVVGTTIIIQRFELTAIQEESMGQIQIAAAIFYTAGSGQLPRTAGDVLHYKGNCPRVVNLDSMCPLSAYMLDTPSILNPRHACAARVAVVDLCVCLFVRFLYSALSRF